MKVNKYLCLLGFSAWRKMLVRSTYLFSEFKSVTFYSSDANFAWPPSRMIDPIFIYVTTPIAVFINSSRSTGNINSFFIVRSIWIFQVFDLDPDFRFRSVWKWNMKLPWIYDPDQAMYRSVWYTVAMVVKYWLILTSSLFCIKLDWDIIIVLLHCYIYWGIMFVYISNNWGRGQSLKNFMVRAQS